MKLPMAKKKNNPQLTFKHKKKIKVKEVSPKEKKEKGMLMTFPMAKKKHHPQLTFIAQAEIQVQEVSPKEKKRKWNVNDVPNGKKTPPPAYFHSSSRNQGPGSVP